MLISTLLALQRQHTRLQGQRPGRERSGRVLHAEAGRNQQVLQRGAAPDLGAAGRGASRAGHRRALAGSGLLRGTVYGRALQEGRRRRGSAGAVPHGVARILLDAGRPDHQPAATSTTTIGGWRESRHRQSEPRAADVPEHGCGQSPDHVDGSGDEVHRRQHGSETHRGHRPGRRRRERRAESDDDRLSPDDAGNERRPPLRARKDGPVPAGSDHYEGDSGSRGGSAGRAAGDARRRSRGGAVAEPHQRAGVQRFCRRRARHRGRRRRRRAGVLRQRTHAGVRRPPRDRLNAVRAAGPNRRRRRGDWHRRHRRWRRRRHRARGRRRQPVAGIERPSALPTIAAAALLVLAAVLASLVPAARAAKVDVISALRAD